VANIAIIVFLYNNLKKFSESLRYLTVKFGYFLAFDEEW
jgi:hypothetical protein